MTSSEEEQPGEEGWNNWHIFRFLKPIPACLEARKQESKKASKKERDEMIVDFPTGKTKETKN